MVEWGKLISSGISVAGKANEILKGLPYIRRSRLWLKRKAISRTLRDVHFNVIHRMRRMSPQVSTWDEVELTDISQEICTACCEIMASLLGLKPNGLHCCLKLIDVLDDGTERISTYVRSQPTDSRAYERGAECAHDIQPNSVWCAMFGRDDPSTRWKPFCCFICNDLTKHDDFHCDRGDWRTHYKSTLVFPIRYVKSDNLTEALRVGFLAFDSPSTNVFTGLPDIFEFRKNPAEYQERLHDSPIFHLGAIFADLLGTIIGPAYETHCTLTKGT